MDSAGILPQKAAAKYLGVSVKRLYRWRKRRTSPPYHALNGRLFYRMADLDAWIRAGRVDG